MFTLLVVGLVAGLITSISPCVLPVLPVVLAAGSSRLAGADGRAGGGRWRPIGVVVGLVLSFSLSTLLGSVVLSALGLPLDLLRNAGIVVLVVVGLSLVVPKIGGLLERPLARLPRRAVNPDSNGVVLGLGLGLLYVPCAGPVLATIAVVGATHRIGFDAVVLTVAFGVGAGIPLLALALAGDALFRRTSALRRRAGLVRTISGLVMIAIAVAIGFNLTDGLQRHVPGYTSALQDKVESQKNVAAKLKDLTAHQSTSPGTAKAAGNLGGSCTADGTALENCGRAPQFTGLTGWLNTPDDSPLNLTALRGKVVLVDFWTYSCINCQRTLPHVEAWYRNYQRSGLVVVGVHTPEFAFEHVTSNISAQAASLGVKYPIAIDNNYATWNAYSNQYWPAEYLIDANGNIRHVSFGEGGYSTTESLIRSLLTAAHPTAALAAPTDIATAKVAAMQTPETYLGYKYVPLRATTGLRIQPNFPTSYFFPAKLDPDTFALSGGWTEKSEDLVAGANAQLRLSFRARKVYLVLGGTGSVTVSTHGGPARHISVGGTPKLYELVSASDGARSMLSLDVSSGVQAYDFTFG